MTITQEMAVKKTKQDELLDELLSGYSNPHGKGKKRVQSGAGEFEIEVPRDLNCT